VALSVVILTLLPAMAAAAPVDDDPAVAARLTTSETVERIPLAGVRGPVECSVDALMRTIRLRSSQDSPAKLLSKIAGRTGVLCPTVVIRDGAVELTCRSRRFDAKIVRQAKTQYLDINELRGLPWRSGLDRAPGYFFDPWRVGIGQACPGKADAARGECVLKQGNLLKAARYFRLALSTQHRPMASLRLGDLAIATGDPVTAIGWYRRVGNVGVFGQFAAGRLCELEGTCLGSTAEVRRTFNPRGMPEPMRAETLMHAARAEAYLGRLRAAVKIIADQIQRHGVNSLCRENADLLCRRILLLAMREAVLPPEPTSGGPAKGAAGRGTGEAAGSDSGTDGEGASVAGGPGRTGEPPGGGESGESGDDGEDDGESGTVAITEADHLTNLMQVFFALPSWDKGPLAVDLSQGAAAVALKMGAPGFAGNLLVSAAREVPRERLSSHLLLAVEAFLSSGDVVRARVVAEYVETRLGPKGRGGDRWRAALKVLGHQDDEDDLAPELRAEIEKEVAASLEGLRDARAAIEKARAVMRGVKDASEPARRKSSGAHKGSGPTSASAAPALGAGEGGG
jgi:hypothetical protein